MKRLDEKELRDFCARHNVAIRSESTSEKGTILNLERCVFNESHVDSGKLMISAKGTISYKCHHDSCASKTISDFIKHFEPDFYKDADTSIKRNASPGTEIELKSMDSIQEEEAQWLIPTYIPAGQITLLVGDGGTAKTLLWCNIIAGLTSGRKTVFDEQNPFEETLSSKVCMFFSSEDSVSKVLKKRLRKAGASLEKVFFLDLSDENFERIKFDSQELEQIISKNKPALVVFDPLQSFIPSNVQMGARNQMRQCLSPLIAIGERYGTTFLILMHTNKRQNSWGRTRCADSADIWDIARSVMIVGHTGEGDVFYLSHEKTNYGDLGTTILYSVEDGVVVYKGTSDKHDREYVSDNAQVIRSSPARNEAKEIIMNMLSDGHERKVIEVDESVKAAGVSFSTLKRAKSELKSEGKIKYRFEGFGRNKVFYVRKMDTSVRDVQDDTD